MPFKSKYEEKLFKERYARAGNEQSWEDVFKRVCKHVTVYEPRQKQYFDAMSKGLFLPSSPQLWNFGVPGETAGSSCFVFDIDDTLESIWKADETARNVYKASGGIGFNLSKCRPRGSQIGNSPNPAVGVLSIAERLNLTTRYITAGGRARGALMLQLDVDHPDIIEFILAKRPIRRNTGQEPAEFDLPLTQCNMSVRCSDQFMQAVELNKEWILTWNNEKTHGNNPVQFYSIETWEKYDQVWKQTLNETADPLAAFFYQKVLLPAIKDYSGIITAKQIWDLIIDNAWNHADPGIVFSDEYERRNTTPKQGLLLANPCSEFIAPPNDACNLASLSLPNIKDMDGNFWNNLVDITKLATWYLNEALNINKIPIEEIDKGNKANRRIGLGIMGLHDLLLMSGTAYASEEGREYASKIMATVEQAAWQTSFDIAEKTGWKSTTIDLTKLTERFEKYESLCAEQIQNGLDKHIDIGHWEGIKDSFRMLIGLVRQGKVPANAAVTSIAPTGTIAQIIGFISGHSGVSSGIEPVFDWTTHRQDNNGSVTINHWLKTCAYQCGLQNDTANLIAPEDHIKMLDAIVKFVSMSCSKCIAKGTLIATSEGIIPIEKCGIAIGTDCFNNSISAKVKNEDDQEIEILSHYSNGFSPTKIFCLSNGYKIETSLNHQLLTAEGLKPASAITINDLLIQKRGSRLFTIGGKALPTVSESKRNKTNSNKFDMPEKMSADLALLLGMIVADGSLTESTGKVGITIGKQSKYDTVEIIFTQLVRQIFGLPVRKTINKRTGCRKIFIISRHLVRWVASLIGWRANDKHTPYQILCGSEPEQASFISGVTLNGFVAEGEGGMTLYEGYSERLRNEIYSMIVNMDLSGSCGQKKIYSPSSQEYTYRVTAWPSEKYGMCGIEPIELHKRISLKTKRHNYIIPDDLEEQIAYLSKNKLHSLKTARRLKQKTARGRFFTSLNVDIKSLQEVVGICRIEDGQAELYDIEVKSKTHLYNVNGLITHNTINLPESATRRDVAATYKMAWSLNTPGTTVYRNNSKPFQVLNSTTVEATTSNVNSQLVSSHSQDSKSRPNRLQGFTEKVPVNLGKIQKNIYITINALNNCPYEVFFAGLNKEDLEESVARELGTVGRLTSLAMRYNVPVEEIIDQLEKIDGQHLFSLPTKLSKLLTAFIKKDKEGNAQLHCKQCGKVTSHQMIDGCKSCMVCGCSAC